MAGLRPGGVPPWRNAFRTPTGNPLSTAASSVTLLPPRPGGTSCTNHRWPPGRWLLGDRGQAGWRWARGLAGGLAATFVRWIGTRVSFPFVSWPREGTLLGILSSYHFPLGLLVFLFSLCRSYSSTFYTSVCVCHISVIWTVNIVPI